MISVIIVSYNTSSLLRQCLAKLYSHSPEQEMEVFVVDNNSSDDSAAMVKREFPKVDLFVNDENLGFAAANNQAWLRSWESGVCRSKQSGMAQIIGRIYTVA